MALQSKAWRSKSRREGSAVSVCRPLLSRPALARVLQSLLSAELAASRGQRGQMVETRFGLASAWPENLLLAGSADALECPSLGCDSLEVLWLSAAMNEMFHLHEAGGNADLLAAKTFGQWIDQVEAAWRSGVNAVTFSTSGSTGVPKHCTQPFAHLQLETAFLANLFSSRKHVLCLTPAHHIYGFLFGAMLADALGDTGGHAGSCLESVARMLQSGDVVVSSPAYWQWLSQTISLWPDDVVGVMSTGSCSPNLIASLLDRGLSAMTEIYGSTETAGVGIREWPAERFRLMPHWVADAPKDSGDPLRLTSSLGRSVSLMDTVEMDQDGAFIVVARRDAAVQVAGTNVFPARIAALLRSQPGVKNAAVRMMRATEGNRLKAFIVPEVGENEEALCLALQSWSDLNLAVAERPKSIRFGVALPLTPLGKGADW